MKQTKHSIGSLRRRKLRVVIIAKEKTQIKLLQCALLVVIQLEASYWVVCLNGRFKIENCC